MKFQDVINNFTLEIIETFTFENLYKTERDILRKNYLEKKKNLFFDYYKKSLDYIKISIDFVNKTLTKLRSRYLNLRALLGILDNEVKISSELSNYLADTQIAISRLPLMYQKLFNVAALHDTRFFVPRTKIINDLKNAEMQIQKSLLGKYIKKT